MALVAVQRSYNFASSTPSPVLAAERGRGGSAALTLFRDRPMATGPPTALAPDKPRIDRPCINSGFATPPLALLLLLLPRSLMDAAANSGLVSWGTPEGCGANTWRLDWRRMMETEACKGEGRGRGVRRRPTICHPTAKRTCPVPPGLPVPPPSICSRASCVFVTVSS